MSRIGKLPVNLPDGVTVNSQRYQCGKRERTFGRAEAEY